MVSVSPIASPQFGQVPSSSMAQGVASRVPWLLRWHPAVDELVVEAWLRVAGTSLRDRCHRRTTADHERVVRADVRQRTEAADGTRRAAGVAPVADELDVERVHLIGLEHLLEQIVSLHQGGPGREHPETRSHAVDVRVDRQLWPPEVEEEDDRRRLTL